MKMMNYNLKLIWFKTTAFNIYVVYFLITIGQKTVATLNER